MQLVFNIAGGLVYSVFVIHNQHYIDVVVNLKRK